MRGLSLSGRLSLEEVEAFASNFLTSEDNRKSIEDSTLLDFLNTVEDFLGKELTDKFGEFLQNSLGGASEFEKWNWGFNKPRFLKVYSYFSAWVNDKTQARVMAYHLAFAFKITMEDLGYR